MQWVHPLFFLGDAVRSLCSPYVCEQTPGRHQEQDTTRLNTCVEANRPSYWIKGPVVFTVLKGASEMEYSLYLRRHVLRESRNLPDLEKIWYMEHIGSSAKRMVEKLWPALSSLCIGCIGIWRCFSVACKIYQCYPSPVQCVSSSTCRLVGTAGQHYVLDL